MTAPSPALRLLTLCWNVPLGVYFLFCFIIHFPILLPIWGKSSCLHICPERQSAFMYRNQELAMCQQGGVTAWYFQIRLSVHCCPQMLLGKVSASILRYPCENFSKSCHDIGNHFSSAVDVILTWWPHTVRVRLETLQLFCVISFMCSHLTSVEEFKPFCRSLEPYSDTGLHWQGRLSPCRKGIQFWREKKIWTLGTCVGHLKLVNSNFKSCINCYKIII